MGAALSVMTRVAWYGPVVRAAIDIADTRGPQLRGWARYAADLASALRQRADVELRELAGWPGPEVLWEQVGFPLAARGCDVLHAPSVFLPLRRPCPGVVTIHDLAFEVFPEDFAPRTRAKFRWLAPRAARSAERVICDSAFTREDVCDRYGIDPAKVRVIPLAPSLPIGDAPVPEREPYALGVGDLRAKKNWQRLAAACPLPLVIAGVDSGEGGALRAAGVEVTGWLDDARLDALMRGAAVLVHPSLYEGYGLVVAEALARGVRVAAARGTSLPEAGGDAAVYFDPLDVGDIRAAIERALAGPAPSVASRTWEAVAAETAAVYAECA
jgi:glycosyltransferase involved in cell wall biosynthesis